MAIQIMLKRKVKGKRKKYKSLEEIPDDLRQAILNTMTSPHQKWLKDPESTIMINGKGYSNTSEMPPDVRMIYEKFMTSLRQGKITQAADSSADNRMSAGSAVNSSISFAGPRAIEPQSSLSSLPRWFIFGVVLLAALIGLYVIIYAVV